MEDSGVQRVQRVQRAQNQSAKITDQNKTDYDQVNYTWTRGNFKYIARWHTRTPNAPTNQKPTWVVERVCF